MKEEMNEEEEEQEEEERWMCFERCVFRLNEHRKAEKTKFDMNKKSVVQRNPLPIQVNEN